MSSKELTLTIVIPVFNEQDYLAGCLDSIAAQTEAPDEVIVVDNNSTDKTAQVAAEYDFVTLLKENEQGITSARNCGFNAARSDIIGRIDADTHLAPGWVEATKRYFADHPQIAAVTGRNYFYDFPLKKLVHLLHTFIYYELQKWIAGTQILWGANMAITRSGWRKVEKFCNRTNKGHEDVDLALCLKKHGQKIGRSREMLAEVSMLRGDTGLLRLAKYLSAWSYTYRANKMYIRTVPIYLLEFLVFTAAFLATPIRLVSSQKNSAKD